MRSRRSTPASAERARARPAARRCARGHRLRHVPPRRLPRASTRPRRTTRTRCAAIDASPLESTLPGHGGRGRAALPTRAPGRPEAARARTRPACLALASRDARLCAAVADPLDARRARPLSRATRPACTKLSTRGDQARCSRDADRWRGVARSAREGRTAGRRAPSRRSRVAGSLHVDAYGADADAPTAIDVDLAPDLARGDRARRSSATGRAFVLGPLDRRRASTSSRRHRTAGQPGARARRAVTRSAGAVRDGARFERLSSWSRAGAPLSTPGARSTLAYRPARASSAAGPSRCRRRWGLSASGSTGDAARRSDHLRARRRAAGGHLRRLATRHGSRAGLDGGARAKCARLMGRMPSDERREDRGEASTSSSFTARRTTARAPACCALAPASIEAGEVRPDPRRPAAGARRRGRAPRRAHRTRASVYDVKVDYRPGRRVGVPAKSAGERDRRRSPAEVPRQLGAHVLPAATGRRRLEAELSPAAHRRRTVEREPSDADEEPVREVALEPRAQHLVGGELDVVLDALELEALLRRCRRPCSSRGCRSRAAGRPSRR